MNRDKQLLLTIELVEFEKYPVEVQDLGTQPITLEGIIGLYLHLLKKNQRCHWDVNWLDLETLGSQPIMLKNIPGHCTSW